MDELIRILTSWKLPKRKGEKKPAPKKPAPVPAGGYVYPEGMSEADKLAMAKERDRKLKEIADAAAVAGARRDIGGPFTKGGKVIETRRGLRKPPVVPVKDRKSPWVKEEEKKSWLRRLLG